ncbi:unnamed protein product [Gongylonema pulchrum]|uniref:C2H2-type domain-containing protein n=1 Tax=Gongylonema pulchrum TaxID=637853 RepID=A0A183DUI6_9BILA|nr:unnamed protein product [Gongylonema pulchrum]
MNDTASVAQLSPGSPENGPTAKKIRKMIKPASINAHINGDVTSHVLSFKCLFCEAFIFTLQSSHPNEDVSEMLSDHFRSCIVSVEKEKVVVVSYAFPRQDVGFYVSVDDASPDSSSNSVCVVKSKPHLDFSVEVEKEPDDEESSVTQLVEPSDVCIRRNYNKVQFSTFFSYSKVDRKLGYALLQVATKSLSPEIRSNESSSDCSTNASDGDAQQQQHVNDHGDSTASAGAVMRSPDRQQPTKGSIPVSSVGSTGCTRSTTPVLSAEISRRRQMSSYEKMMALTCQRCGQSFKNRCMLTRHAIEHKRAGNPYRCTVNGCLDSYGEKRKLITHLNYKHTELSREERELIVLKGDELFEKLRNMYVNFHHIVCYFVVF